MLQVSAALPVDPQVLKYTAVFVGFAIVFAYLLLAHRLKVLSVGALVVLAVLFVGEQAVFSAFVVPVVDAGPVERAESVVVQAQRTFEIGFVAKLGLMMVELTMEDTLSDRTPLRSVYDAGFDVLAVVAVLLAGVVVSQIDVGLGVLLPALSLLFSLKVVETFVDLSVALAVD